MTDFNKQSKTRKISAPPDVSSNGHVNGHYAEPTQEPRPELYDLHEVETLTSCAHNVGLAYVEITQANPAPGTHLFLHRDTEAVFLAFLSASRIGKPNRQLLELALESILEDGYSESEKQSCRALLANLYEAEPPKGAPDVWFGKLRHRYNSSLDPLKNSSGPPAPGTELDDIGNGRRFVAQHGKDVRFCAAWKNWVAFDGHQWIIDERKTVEMRAKETARNIYLEAHGADEEKRAKIAKHAIISAGRARLEAMLFMARSESGIPIMPEDFDADPWLLNCQNGTLDLRTGELCLHSRADLITKITNVIYDAKATCPTFLEFLHQITAQRSALVDFLQLVMGYALTGDTREHALFILHGAGRNGKSTLLEIFEEILNDYALQMESKTITARRQEQMANDIARLRGARFVAASETSEGRHLDEERIKQMTGNKKLTGEFKFGEPFDFERQFKLFLATNHKPEIRGTDAGIWSRIHLIPFDVRFWDADKGESGPEHLRMDKGLPDRLRAEMSGILTWAVEGCLKWQRAGLKMPSEVREATANYREEQDTLAGFFGACCVLDPNVTATAKELFKAYCAWCEEQGEKSLNQTNFGRRLKERGLQNDRNMKGIFWRGIGLLNGDNPMISMNGSAIMNSYEPISDKDSICNSNELPLGKTLHNYSLKENPSCNQVESEVP